MAHDSSRNSASGDSGIQHQDPDYRDAVADAKREFLAKLSAYGPSWMVQRLSSILDRIFAKVSRIRKLEELGGKGRVEDTIGAEFLGVFNYCVMILDKLEHDAGEPTNGFEVPTRWAGQENAARTYDQLVDTALSLFADKNHDYDQAWRKMAAETFTDELMVRLQRIHFLRQSGLISEGGDPDRLRDQVLDMMNYSLFGRIRWKGGQ